MPIAPEEIPERDHLTQMPAEIIYMILDFLSVAERTALTLSCRALYRGFFSESISKSRIITYQSSPSSTSSDKWGILLLLEKEARETEIACWICGKIHTVEYFGGPRCYNLPGGHNQAWGWHIPSHITPDMCRLIARRHDWMGQSDANANENGDALTERMARKWQHVSLPDFKVYTEQRVKMFATNLIYREETFIAPLFGEGGMTTRSARLLMRYLTRKICAHWSWDRVGFDLWFNKRSLSPLYDQGVVADDDSMWECCCRGTDIVGHSHSELEGEKVQLEKKCEHPHDDNGTATLLNTDNFSLSEPAKCALLHPQPCIEKGCLERYAWGSGGHPHFVTACCSCSTEFCLGSQDIPGASGGGGRVLVLSVWKNLGGFGDGGWKHWESHACGNDVKGYEEDISDLGGKMAKAFDDDHSTGFYYKAKISPEVVAALGEQRIPVRSVLDMCYERRGFGALDKVDDEGFWQGWL